MDLWVLKYKLLPAQQLLNESWSDDSSSISEEFKSATVSAVDISSNLYWIK